MAIIIVHPKASSLQIRRWKCNLSSQILLTKAPHLFAFAALLILRIFILQSTQHAPHPVFECFFMFLSNVIFVCPDDPSLIFWNPPTLESLLLSGVFGPSFLFWRMSVSHSYLWLWAYACLCFLFSVSSLHITQSVWFFVHGNYWLRSQPSTRCFSLSLFSLSYLSDFHSVPHAFSFLQSPFVLPIVLAFFSGPCVPLTLSLTHFARAHRWVNHTTPPIFKSIISSHSHACPQRSSEDRQTHLILPSLPFPQWLNELPAIRLSAVTYYFSHSLWVQPCKWFCCLSRSSCILCAIHQFPTTLYSSAPAF